MTNRKSTKRALLGSVVAMVLCLAMLVGATFAWFTDTASTDVNKIQAGKLDVALEMKDAAGQWVSAEGKTLDFVKAAAGEQVLWEPGCTYELTPFQIVNKGNLALKYKVAITGINGICLLLMLTGYLPASMWGVIWTLFVTAGFAFTGKITKIQAVYGKKLQILGTYAGLLKLMEAQPMQCNLLKRIKEEIGGEQRKASLAISRLSKLMNELDQRNNVFMYVILNGLFFWELRQIMRIETWKEQYAHELPHWLSALGQMDALNSLATFAYNHPDYSYPTLLDKADMIAAKVNISSNTKKADTENTGNNTRFMLRAKALGHPLMHRDRCVRNDIDMEKRPFFIIITGANMAGKSTYLRTIGINYLLACTGMPVCAEEMEAYPARLITSLRTSDSLTDNESYFFAELKRLKLIIDKLQSGEELFIILDEILKGTNSMDKQKGSFALIKQFMALQANGIIATHDLLLGTLIDLFPENICNYRFEADITDNELTFSYRLRPGVAQNMNACFLMKKMGIAVAD